MDKQYIKEFNSINQFYNYLCNTPTNTAFSYTGKELASVRGTYEFCKTYSFEQAVNMMKSGWSVMSKKLTRKLDATSSIKPIVKPKNVLSVSGYQPIVPLYLSGIPANMLNKQLVAVKSKVVSVTKLINYSASIKSDVVEEESIKAMCVVKTLEAQGYRVNLNIALGSAKSEREIICKVKIKSANEKLNISKLAFPMVHPSMLRRLMFRYIEVCPDVTSGFVRGYGTPVEFEEMKKAFPHDIVLPSIWEQDIDKIKDIKDLYASV